MKTHEILKTYDVGHWLKFLPSPIHYLKYSKDNANLILAAHKIQDVYIQFTSARASLIYLEIEDYGGLIGENDDFHFAYIRSKFLFDALALYNYCIDLSWQVLYLYYGDTHFGAIQDENNYLRVTRKCDFKNLEKLLVKTAEGRKLFKSINIYWTEPLTEEIREAYNYTKHRGTFHIEGLGINDDSSIINGDGYKLKMISRKSITIEEWKQKLIEFDISFVKYFEDNIISLMPKDFTETSVSFEKMFNTAHELEEWERNRKTAMDIKSDEIK